MNPFLEIPVIAPNGFLGADKEVVGRILPGEIAFHQPYGKGKTLIVLKSGHRVFTSLDPASLDAARQTYEVVLKKNPGRTNNLQIVRNPNKKPEPVEN